MKTMTELKRLHQKLMKLKEETDSSGPFWETHGLFKDELKLVISNKLFPLFVHRLTKKSLFLFMSWCCTYRPREPHVLLSKISQMTKVDDHELLLLLFMEKMDKSDNIERTMITEVEGERVVSAQMKDDGRWVNHPV